MYNIISAVAIIFYFVPMLVVLAKHIWKDQFFLLFAIYWFVSGLVNMTDLLPGFPQDMSYNIGVLYNALDIPIILTILYSTTTFSAIKKFIAMSMIVVVVSEAVGIGINGFHYESLKYSLGIGVAVVLVIVVWEILEFVKTVEHTNHQNARVFIHAALLFEYATFILIYIFDYIVVTADRTDNYLIYYISSIVTILIACCGYLLYKKQSEDGVTVRGR